MARLEGFVWESKTNMDSKSCQKLGGDVFRIVPRRLFSQREKETWEYHTLTLNLFILEDIFLTFQHPQKRWSWIYPIPVVWFMIRDLPNTGGIGCAGDEPTRTPGVTPKFYHPKTTPTTWRIIPWKHSLKLTANAPEHRPGPQKETSIKTSIYSFSGALLVLVRVVSG